jgi:hypothetical protein
MEDRAYTRFSIPAHHLTPESRKRVCTTFGVEPGQLDAILQCRPLPLESGYEDGIALRLVQGCPCLVIEDANVDHGGSAAEAELEQAGIPFLRLNDAGRDYGGSQTAFDGLQAASIRLDVAGDVIVGVGIGPDRSIEVDAEELEDVERFMVLSTDLLALPAG